ncbi:helix-turn-helix domain-containing protein [Defluviimonas aestuarii]|uniref:GlxA family transcriptional regulator n=1 Tax=Albidovulum aestuarii TaxID=1130726 RepID=UPI00249A4492|nr:helix-turn-helix domain-containing protein [Defluviimonas aestuarii]MDI3335632.1 helix-turn-helix domain-containing protein [Defluviimonas aestuarii]
MALYSSFDDNLLSSTLTRRESQDLDVRLRIAIVLSDGFSMLALGAIAEALSLAGRLSGERFVQSLLFGINGTELRSRSGIQITVGQALSEAEGVSALAKSYDAMILCTGNTLSVDDERAVRLVARIAKRHGKSICVIGAAIRTLAESGHVLRCTEHWNRATALQETVSTVSVSDTIFCRDGLVVTSPGETAALDLTLALIRERLGHSLAGEVAAQLLAGTVRTGLSQQPRFAANRFRGIPRTLSAAIDKIEASIEYPLPLSKLASSLNISPRQLERLFAKYIRTSPQRYTRQTQLKHAMKLLEQSSMPIVEVALACGFRGTSTFNKSFKRAFGVTPIKFRRFGANPADEKPDHRAGQ